MLTLYHRTLALPPSEQPHGGSPQLQLLVRPGRRRHRYRSRSCANFKKEQRRRRLGPRRPRAAARNEATVIDVVGEMERRRTLLTSFMVNARMHSLDHAIRVAEGFYLLLAKGYSPSRDPDASQAAASFLRSNMSHDVEWTTVRGVEVFLHHHQLYTEAHASVQISVVDVTLSAEAETDAGEGRCFDLRAKGVALFRISRDTLAQFFPSVLEDEFAVQEFIGQEYSIQYSKVFRIRNGLITSHGPFVEDGDGGDQLRLIRTPRGFEQHMARSLALTHNVAPGE